MAEYTFWKFKWAYYKDDPAVTYRAVAGRGYYEGYSAGGAFRGLYLKADEPASAAGPVIAQPAVPEPVNQKFAGWGRVIPISMGQRRMSPQIIWLRQPISIGVTATADFAVSWGYNADDNPENTVVTALYADATLIWTLGAGRLLPGAWSWTYYPGTEEQLPDPTMVAANGAANTPAYRNQLVGVFRNFPLEKFGFKLPGISAEIAGSGGEMPRNDSWNPDDKHPFVVLESPFTISKHTPAGSPSDEFAAVSVRSQTSHRRGQYYFELTLDAQWRGAWFGLGGTVGVGGGVRLATDPLSQTAGNTNESIGAATPSIYVPAGPTNRLWSGTSWQTAGPPEWFAGQTMGFHINMTEGYARARNVSVDSAWTSPLYYVNPPKPPSFAAISLGDPLYASASVAMAPDTVAITYSDRQTVNFGASPFLGAIPAGATAWNGDGGTGDLLGLLPLRDFISKISTYCGLVPEIDLSFEGIDDTIHGGLITRDTTFSDFLTVLGRAFGFDFYEGEQIRIVRRVIGSTYVIDKVIPREDLIVEGDRSIQTTRRNDDSPTEIELSYIDRTQQFRWNIQKARRILFPVKTTRSVRKDAFAIPIITLADNALTMAGRALYREAMQNVDHEASMLPRHLAVEPSDILTITAGDTEYTVKVTSISMNADGRLGFSAVNLLTDEDMAWDADGGSPNLPYQGNLYRMAATEGADTFTGSVAVVHLVAMEGADTFTGLHEIVGLFATDRPDTFTGTNTALGTMSATEGADRLLAMDVTDDPYFGYVVLLSGFEGADAAAAPMAEDATGKIMTFAGNAQLDTAQKKFGASSLLLDGTGDYLTLADHAHWTIGANQFTIEAWVRFAAIGYFDDHCIIAQSGTSEVNFQFYQSGANSLRFAMGTAGGASGGLITGTWSPVIDTWYHVAVDRDVANKVRVYADGVMIGSGTDATVLFNSTKLMHIGRLEFNTAFDFQGHIDEIRFTNGIARYASDSGFAVPITAFPPAGLMLDLDFTTMG